MQDTGDKGVFAEDNSEIMEINSAGVVLSYYRDKYGLTLEQVCDGICSTSKLLRMEKGKRCVDSLTSSQLLERIGKMVDQFEQLLNEEDYALWCARESIRKHMQHKEYDRVREDLTAYRAMKNRAHRLHEQFCSYYEIMMAEDQLENGESAQRGLRDEQAKLCENALRALRLTKPAFVPGSSGGKQLYTSTEIGLILRLVHYGKYNNDAWAEEILLDLFRHIECYDTERRKQKMGYLILMELIELEQRLQEPDKELAYIDQGIDFVAQGRDIGGLDRLHFLKAQALMRRYGAAALKEENQGGFGGRDVRREIQRECLMAYSICEVFGDMQQMEAIRRFCGEELRWQITGLEM
ncbi:MAG: hypothetical protein K2I96_03545 [Lachnospiraceae bacterium]|nr:hypothetical protein [Lachnospiraceae bacterium]